MLVKYDSLYLKILEFGDTVIQYMQYGYEQLANSVWCCFPNEAKYLLKTALREHYKILTASFFSTESESQKSDSKVIVVFSKITSKTTVGASSLSLAEMIQVWHLSGLESNRHTQSRHR